MSESKEKRVRHVMPDSDVAHAWANQTQSDARNAGKTFYFEGATIYSYGGHFPIARIVDRSRKGRVVLFTLDTYSSTTAKHIGTVKMASSHLEKVYCLEPTASIFTARNSEFLAKRVSNILDKISRARLPESYLPSLADAQKDLERYYAFWGKKIPAKMRRELFPALDNLAALNADRKAKRIKAEKAARIRFEKQHKLGAALFVRGLDAWRNYGERAYAEALDPNQRAALRNYENALGAQRPAYIRFNAEKFEVETSKHVNIPADVALRFYESIKAKGAALIGTNFLNFPITGLNGSLRIGCHNIPMEEIERLAPILRAAVEAR